MTDFLTRLQNDDEFYQEEFLNLNASDTEGKLIASGCRFTRISFANSDILLDCTDTVFTQCDFQLTKLRNSSLSRVRFENCTFSGTDFCESFLRDCSFIGCKGDMLNLSNCKLQRSDWNDCVFQQGYFENDSMKNCKLQNCNLTSSYFHGTSLKQMDLTNCKIDQLRLRRDDLKGAILTADQAMSFLWMLEIHIR
jgi:uncharacterized protein YjbI with pentapeptide repeats